MIKLLVITSVLSAASVVDSKYDGPIYNQAIFSLGKAVRHFVTSQTNDFKISDGVRLVSTANDRDDNNNDSSIFGTVSNYLQTHEIKIDLPELLPNGQDVGRAFKESINDIGTGRGKNKGAGGALLLLGSMFASMLGALGIGGVGLLAMKALTVSAMALLLAAVVGVKKLASGHDDGGGHHVIHADHRKKREASNIAYDAWNPANSS